MNNRWRLKPCLMNGNKRGWLLESSDMGGSVWVNFGYFTSIKAAKSVVAHMKRKPIELS